MPSGAPHELVVKKGSSRNGQGVPYVNPAGLPGLGKKHELGVGPGFKVQLLPARAKMIPSVCDCGES